MTLLIAATLLGAVQPVTLNLAKFSTTAKFDLVFTNATKEKRIIVNDGCSWGWDSTSFELKSPAGKSFAITRIQKPWSKNFPMGDTLKPLGKLARTINLADGTWRIPTEVKGNLKGWQVRAVFTPETLAAADERLFWTGKTLSPWIPAK